MAYVIRGNSGRAARSPGGGFCATHQIIKIVSHDLMNTLLAFVAVIALVALITGWFKPTLVRMPSKKRSSIVYGAILVVALILFTATEPPTPPTTQTQVPAAVPAKTAAPSSSSNVTLGQNGYLRLPSSGDATVFTTEQALTDYTKAAVENDTTGMAQIIQDGEGYFVPQGTKVLLIDYGGIGQGKVRLLEGDHSGEAVWVPTDFISAQ